uniref:Phage protein n=1 Tax=Bacillus phage PHBA67-T TaxID=3233536 RepID=A0AAU7YPF9_9CAUD
MNIPKQLMIGSVPYDVEVVKGWLEERENGEVRIAEVTYHEQQIKISDNVAKHEGQMKNVLHEAIHAMLYEYGFDRLNKEANVNALTTVFFDFIENNIRGGISSFVGYEYLVFTSHEKQVEKEDDLSFINTAAELVETINQHEPKVDVSALGTAMAQAEVHKTIDLQAVTPEQIRDVVKDTVKNRNRKLPIVGVNRSSFPMEDVVKITKQKDRSCAPDPVKKEEADPTHWKTGIKYDDEGTPRYRTRYECCMCGNRGNQYEYEGNKFTKCHKCNAKLKIVKATENGFPERDAFGNFYVANEEYSVILDGE